MSTLHRRESKTEVGWCGWMGFCLTSLLEVREEGRKNLRLIFPPSRTASPRRGRRTRRVPARRRLATADGRREGIRAGAATAVCGESCDGRCSGRGGGEREGGRETGYIDTASEDNSSGLGTNGSPAGGGQTNNMKVEKCTSDTMLSCR